MFNILIDMFGSAVASKLREEGRGRLESRLNIVICVFCVVSLMVIYFTNG